jgi:hypothetical protein
MTQVLVIERVINKVEEEVLDAGLILDLMSLKLILLFKFI